MCRSNIRFFVFFSKHISHNDSLWFQYLSTTLYLKLLFSFFKKNPLSQSQMFFFYFPRGTEIKFSHLCLFFKKLNPIPRKLLYIHVLCMIFYVWDFPKRRSCNRIHFFLSNFRTISSSNFFKFRKKQIWQLLQTWREYLYFMRLNLRNIHGGNIYLFFTL